MYLPKVVAVQVVQVVPVVLDDQDTLGIAELVQAKDG